MAQQYSDNSKIRENIRLFLIGCCTGKAKADWLIYLEDDCQQVAEYQEHDRDGHSQVGPSHHVS